MASGYLFLTVSKSHILGCLQSWFQIPELSHRSFDTSICHYIIRRDVLLPLSRADPNIVPPGAVIMWDISLEQWGWKLGQAEVRDGVNPAGVARSEQGWEGGQMGDQSPGSKQVHSPGSPQNCGLGQDSRRQMSQRQVPWAGPLLASRFFVIDLSLIFLLTKRIQLVNIIWEALCSHDEINFKILEAALF